MTAMDHFAALLRHVTEEATARRTLITSMAKHQGRQPRIPHVERLALSGAITQAAPRRRRH